MAFTGIFPAAEVVPAPFGLSSVATVVNHRYDDSNWVSGYEQEYSLCDVLVQGWDMCASAAAATIHDSSSADRFGKVHPYDIVVIDGCDSPIGPNLRAEHEQHLMDLLDIASIKAAEQELWNGAITIASESVAADRNKYLSGPTGTSVGTALSPLAALAALEDALSDCGAGETGVIHMTRGAASFLGHVLVRDGDQLTTMAGTKVSAGSGYKSGGVGANVKMYATGPVLVHLGAPALLSDNQADYFDPAANKLVLQASRPVAATWDGCCHFSADVDYTP